MGLCNPCSLFDFNEVRTMEHKQYNFTFMQSLLICTLALIEDMIPIVTLNLYRPQFAGRVGHQIDQNNQAAAAAAAKKKLEH